MDPPTIILHLRELYDKARRTARFDASRKFVACKMSEGTTVRVHYFKMINSIEKLGKLGFSMDYVLSIDINLFTLPDSFS